MLRPFLPLLFALGAALPAQISTRTVQDVGLVLAGGPATTPTNAVTGQACGPFTCTPFVAGPISSTTGNTLTRAVRVYGAPNSLFVLFLSFAPLPQPCQAIAGIDNALILGMPAQTMAIGVTGAPLPSPSAVCLQGVAVVPLTFPNITPAAVVFRLQALAMSTVGQGPAFTVAVQATLR